MRLILLICLGMLCQVPLLFAQEQKAVITPNWERLANAIYKAEGGAKTRHPYGILKRYKTTTSRQACINTCKHAWKDYLAGGGIVRPGASNAKWEPYLEFLQRRYAPRGVANDPTDLNRHWLKNVTFYYERG